MRIYNSAEYAQLSVDEREENGVRFDRALARDRRAAVLEALTALYDAVGDGYEFKVEVIAKALGTNVLWSRWMASEVIHGCSIKGFDRVRGARHLSVFTT